MKQKKLMPGALSIVLAITMFSTAALAASVRFTDVPDSHWASSSIAEMADKSIVSGIGNNFPAPSSTLTGAEFVIMVVRRLYEDKLGTEDEKWYSGFVDATEGADILTGINAIVEDTISRYDIAQLMYNILKAEGITTPSLSDTSKVVDWASVLSIYRGAVSVCYNMGMLTDVNNKDTFNGTRVMDRAQTAVTIDRLLEVCFGGALSTPEKPADSLILINDDTPYIKGDGPKYENGVFHLYDSGFGGIGGWIHFNNTEYLTLTLTVSVHDVEYEVTVNSAGSMISNDQRLSVIQDLDTTRAYSADVSGTGRVTIGVSYGGAYDAEVPNIYLS